MQERITRKHKNTSKHVKLQMQKDQGEESSEAESEVETRITEEVIDTDEPQLDKRFSEGVRSMPFMVNGKADQKKSEESDDDAYFEHVSEDEEERKEDKEPVDKVEIDNDNHEHARFVFKPKAPQAINDKEPNIAKEKKESKKSKVEEAPQSFNPWDAVLDVSGKRHKRKREDEHITLADKSIQKLRKAKADTVTAPSILLDMSAFNAEQGMKHVSELTREQMEIAAQAFANDDVLAEEFEADAHREMIRDHEEIHGKPKDAVPGWVMTSIYKFSVFTLLTSFVGLLEL